MGRLLIGVLLLGVSVGDAVAQTRVDGYVRRDGTYVAPHYRSSPDGSRLNNYGTQGNVNPFTGQTGSQPAYPSPSTNSFGRQPNNLNSYGTQRRLY